MAYNGNDYAEPWLGFIIENNESTYNKKVVLTFLARTDTTVPIYYTQESYVNSKPDDTISLKANEVKTVVIHKDTIYRFGIVDYDTTITKQKSVNNIFDYVGIKIIYIFTRKILNI